MEKVKKKKEKRGGGGKEKKEINDEEECKEDAEERDGEEGAGMTRVWSRFGFEL